MKRSFILLSIILVAASVQAQEQTSFGMNIHMITPQGAFRQEIDRLGIGIQFAGSYRFSGTPFALGGEFAFHNYGVDSRDERFSTTIPDLKVRVENSYNQLAFLLLGRAEPIQTGTFRPYLEALWGGNYFFTETSIRNRFSSDDEPIARDTNIDDWAMTWGGGAGMQLLVHETTSEVFNGPGEEMKTVPTKIFVNIGARYMLGNEATYLKKGSVRVNNGQVTYDTSRSKTDMMIIQLGMTVKF